MLNQSQIQENFYRERESMKLAYRSRRRNSSNDACNDSTMSVRHQLLRSNVPRSVIPSTTTASGTNKIAIVIEDSPRFAQEQQTNKVEDSQLNIPTLGDQHKPAARREPLQNINIVNWSNKIEKGSALTKEVSSQNGLSRWLSTTTPNTPTGPNKQSRKKLTSYENHNQSSITQEQNRKPDIHTRNLPPAGSKKTTENQHSGRICELEQEVKQLRAKQEVYRREIESLTNQVAALRTSAYSTEQSIIKFESESWNQLEQVRLLSQKVDRLNKVNSDLSKNFAQLQKTHKNTEALLLSLGNLQLDINRQYSEVDKKIEQRSLAQVVERVMQDYRRTLGFVNSVLDMKSKFTRQSPRRYSGGQAQLKELWRWLKAVVSQSAMLLQQENMRFQNINPSQTAFMARDKNQAQTKK